jgi:hypothetical protein
MRWLAAIWSHVRRALIALGTVMGAVNTAVLLTAVYLVFVPLIRLGFAVTRRDVLGHRRHARRGSTWVVLEGSARAPTLRDLEDQF